MADKFKLSRKAKKIILGACIGGVVVLTAGLFTYIHIAERLVSGKPTDCVCRVRRVNFADCAGDVGSAGAAGKQAERKYSC